MKKRILSVMMAMAMTISVSALSAVVNINSAPITAYADEVNEMTLDFVSDHVYFPNMACAGRAVLGETIHFNAVANGVNNANVTYSYDISGRNMMGHGSVSMDNLSGCTDATWTPEYTGEYCLNVTAKDNETGKTATAQMFYCITNPITLASFTGDYAYGYPSECYGQASAKEWINLKTQCTGGVGELSYTYRIDARNGRYHSSLTHTSADGTMEWMPAYPDIYQITVTVTDQVGHSASYGYCYDIR